MSDHGWPVRAIAVSVAARPGGTKARMMDPLVIEAALNGGTPKSRNRHLPRTAEEITRDAFACLGAGAAIIHSHIEDFAATGEAAAESCLDGWRPVLAARPDVIFASTSARGATSRERFGHCRPLADRGMRMAALDTGSVNLASHGPDGLPPTAKALEAYLGMMEGCAVPWSAAVIGGDVTQTGLARMAIERGGHVRVGLEDFGGERAPMNAELVAEVAAMAAECGRAVATPAEAAEILRLP